MADKSTQDNFEHFTTTNFKTIHKTSSKTIIRQAISPRTSSGITVVMLSVNRASAFGAIACLKFHVVCKGVINLEPPILSLYPPPGIIIRACNSFLMFGSFVIIVPSLSIVWSAMRVSATDFALGCVFFAIAFILSTYQIEAYVSRSFTQLELKWSPTLKLFGEQSRVR